MSITLIEAQTGKGHTVKLAPMTGILDEGCQTNAPKARLFVTALGEVLRDNDVLNCSSVNLSELAQREGFDWKKTCIWREGKHKSKEALRWFKAIKDEFERKRQDCLSLRENQFVHKVYALQDQAPPGRYRVYGELRKNGHERIVLVTEFLALVSEEGFWSQVDQVRRDTDAKLWVMSEDTRSDHSYQTYPDGTKIPGSDKYGPGHGEVERQVELSWRIENMQPDEVAALVVRLTSATAKIWKEGGVGVC